MIFDKYQLSEWYYLNLINYDKILIKDNKYSRKINVGEYIPPAAIYLYEKNNIVNVAFYYKLSFLNNIFNKKIIIGSADDVKFEIDKFLIKIDKLATFL